MLLSVIVVLGARSMHSLLSPFLYFVININIIILIIGMGNQPICAKDTRDFKNSTYLVCGAKEYDFRNSTSINMVNQIPVVTGPPLNFQKQQTFKKVQRSAAQFCQENGLDMMYVSLVARIIAYGHNNIFMAYRKLSKDNRQLLLQEIKYADIDFLDSLYHKFILGQKQAKKTITPPTKVFERDSLSQKQKLYYTQIGNKMLVNGEVAFFFLCAGSSSRFLYQQKFLYPLDLKSNKTLLQLLLQRLRRNLRVPSTSIASVPLIFACNQNNRILIQNYLSSKKYCGFDVNKIRFLTIPNIPVLNPKGKLCLTFEYKILNRPSGTGKCLEELLGSGLLNWLKNYQVSSMHVVGCENLMENPGDPTFLGYFKDKKLEVLGKCTDTIFPTEQFNRYSGANDGKTYLLNPQQILNMKINEAYLESLMQKCPIALNSMVIGLQELKSITKDYQNSMFLSQQYNAYKKSENFYDFEKQRPMMNSLVYVFEKQMGHLLTCSSKHALMRIPREEFIPIITKNGSYSMKQACKKFVQQTESSLNFSRITQ